jgi:diadenosine tetraphosphatase ApaH/serine/threonine PP2A family protein phosphatase
MLIGLFSDIHANREAFSACLKHSRECAVERQVFLGDYVGYGADPGWVVDMVMSSVEAGATAVLGNHDAAITAPRLRMNEVAQIAIAWTRQQLSDVQRAFLQSLPLSVTDHQRLYVHANAWAPEQWGYVQSPADAAQSLFATRCRLTFCGHVHAPTIYHLGGSAEVVGFTPVSADAITLFAGHRWLAVLGAVGQPRDGIPAASYAIFDTERSSLTIVRVPYDVETAARKVRAAGLPPVLSERLTLGW